MAKKINIPKDKNIIDIPIEEAMPDNYLPYAVEVAKDRALPDVRDGLKPVHRRILYGAYMLRAFHDRPYYKSARIVGDILGKYHPHGDMSVYDAMVILAQDFVTRVPLIDGHGNWGSIDGDSAAAMRYTEARLTQAAQEMLRDIDKNVVDMVDNYSDTEKEPEVLPARYPNLLVNGAFGIAVGLATNIPPHNLGEVIDGVLAYIENNNITTKELINYIKGPDLPTGGILIGEKSLLSAYETGEGKVTLRAKTNIETLENGRLGIVITEFPYRKNKAKLLQNISEMTGEKRYSKILEAITDIRDESDRNGIRAVIELKKSTDKESAEKILKYLFKKTELQCNISFNMVALAEGKPRTLNLKEMIKYYVLHQKEVITRRTKRELEIAEKRFHIVEGFIKAIGIMDDIIKTIRASKSKKDAEQNLCEKFGFTTIQAQAIVELMLYKLTGLEVKTFEKEYNQLKKTIKKLKSILESEKVLLKVIKEEILEIKEKYNTLRRTKIIKDDNEAKIELEEIMVVEDVMITLSNEGYIKKIPLKTYNRANYSVEDIEYREGDFNKFLIKSNSIDSLILFTSKGNMYQIKTIKIPELRWKEKGEKLEDLIRGLNLEKETILSVFSIRKFDAQNDIIFFTNKGNIKKSPLCKFDTAYSKLMALKLKKKEKLIDARLVENTREEKFILVDTKLGLNYTVEEPKLESVDRNIASLKVVDIGEKDEITKIEYTDKYQFKSFFAKINNKGIIKNYENARNLKGLICFTDSSCKLLIFLNNGEVILIPSYIIQNIDKKGLDLKLLVNNFKDSRVEVVNIFSIRNFKNDTDVYFFTKKGLIKRTNLKDFDGDYISTLGYKFKKEGDILVNVEFKESINKKDVLIITKNAMCIRFDADLIRHMGKAASGVKAISLKQDDCVVYSKLVVSDKDKNLTENNEIMIINSLNGSIQEINLKDIKSQNPAGIGKALMVVVMGDYINDVRSE